MGIEKYPTGFPEIVDTNICIYILMDIDGWINGWINSWMIIG